MNIEKLRKIIEDKGVTYVFIANKLGITKNALSRKMNEKSDFKCGEMKTIAEILQISAQDFDEIFFGIKVGK